MKKEIKVDVSILISKLHENWDGIENDTFKKHVNKNKGYIIDTVKDRVSNIDTYDKPVFKFNHNEKQVSIIFEWKEKENINEWMNNIKVNVNEIVNYFWGKGINAYTM